MLSQYQPQFSWGNGDKENNRTIKLCQRNCIENKVTPKHFYGWNRRTNMEKII